MWGGTTRTIAVTPDPATGGGNVVHVSRAATALNADNAGVNNRLVGAWYDG